MFLIINLISLKKIYISSDHAGFKLKEIIKKHLIKKKINYFDLGPSSDNRVDRRQRQMCIRDRRILRKYMMCFLQNISWAE